MSPSIGFYEEGKKEEGLSNFFIRQALLNFLFCTLTGTGITYADPKT